MGWKHLGIITLALCVNVLAQQGYNYDRPEKPFSGTSKQTPDTYPRGPTEGSSGSNGYTPTGEPTGIPSRQYLEPLTKPGYPKPSQTLTSPNPYSGNQGTSSQSSFPGSGSQQFGSKPSGPGLQFPTTSGYPDTRPSTLGNSGAGSRFTPTPGYPSSKPSGPGSQSPSTPRFNEVGTSGSQFPSTAGYPGSKSSGSQSQFPVTSGYPSSRPSTAGFNDAGTSGSQFPPTSGYPSSKHSEPGTQLPATSGYPSSRPSTPGSNKAGNSGSQFPPTSGYPSSEPSGPGSHFPAISGYPTSRPSTPGSSAAGTLESRFPSTSNQPSSKPSGPEPRFPATSGYPTSRPSAPGYNGPFGLDAAVPSGTGTFVPKQYPGNQQQFDQGPSGSRAPGFSRQFGSNQADQQFPQDKITGPADSNAPHFNGPNQAGQQFSGQFGVPSFQQQYEDNSIDEGDYSAIPGEPGRDYSILSEVPETSFTCDQQEYPGYYADVETRCQAFHICANKKSYDFLCPNGTVFHQEHLVCVWWNQFDCESAPSLYSINAKIYEEGLKAAERNQFASPQQLGENAVRYPTENQQAFGQELRGSTRLPTSGPSNNGYEPANQAASRAGQPQSGNGRPESQGSQEYPRPGQSTSQFDNGKAGSQGTQGYQSRPDQPISKFGNEVPESQSPQYPRPGQSTLQFGTEKPGSRGPQGYPSRLGRPDSQFGNEVVGSQGSQGTREYARPGESTSQFGNERPGNQAQGYPSRPGQPIPQFGSEEPRSEGPQGYPRPGQPTPQFGNGTPRNQEARGYPSPAPSQSTRYGQGGQESQGYQGYPRSGQSTPQYDNEKPGNQGAQEYPSSGPSQATKFGQGGQGTQEYSRPRQQQIGGVGTQEPSNYPGSNQSPAAAYPGQTQTSLSRQYPDHSTTGYPSGRPEPGQNPFGPSRSQQGPGRTQLGGNEQATQGQTSPANKPTREYLPPISNKK